MASTSCADFLRRERIWELPSSSSTAAHSSVNPNSVNIRYSENNAMRRPHDLSPTQARADSRIDFHTPPSHGAGLLELRSMVLADGSMRTYYALPPDYENFSRIPRPNFRPEFPAARDLVPQKPHFPVDDGSRNLEIQSFGGKRKFDENEEVEGNDDRFERRRPKEESLLYGKENEEKIRAEITALIHGKVNEHNQIDSEQKSISKAFSHFVKLIYQSASHKKKYLSDGKEGHLRCLACSRPHSNFLDVHSLVLHAYYADAADSIVNHLALYKSLCVLMGWNYGIPPDTLKAYQNFSTEESEKIRADLIMWPPIVLVSSTARKGEKDHVEGIGNKRMDSFLKELGFRGCKSTAMYSRKGHMGIHTAKFSGDEAGLKEALRLADYFQREKRRIKCPTEDKTWEVFDARLGTVTDLDKLTVEYKKKVTIASLREFIQKSNQDCQSQ